jgi:hypothetical protein
MKKDKIFVICLCFLISADIIAQSSRNTIILSDSLDSYYELAIEISENENENYNLIHEFNQIILSNTDFILWVASPKYLTEKKLVEISQFRLENRINTPIGIISGKNINDARYLWENRNFRPNGKYVIFNGTSVSNRIKPKILIYHNNEFDTLTLNKANFTYELANSEYIQVSLHGAARSWFDEKSHFEFKYNELPDLENTVIQSHSCNNFRPWIDNSIALESINKGAVLFSGFIYSPISGSKIGGYDGLNFRYTWNEFPIGVIIQIQNRASLRSYAKFEHNFILGDPRISFNEQPPYEIYEDNLTQKERLIKLRNAKNGFLPVKIDNGSDYTFISIADNIRHSSNDIFFNKNIESVNIKGDKYILFNNISNTVDIKLRKKTPLLWKIKDTVMDFIDTSIVSHQYTGFNILIGGVFLVLIFIGLLRRKLNNSDLIHSLIISLLLTAIIGFIYVIRWHNFSITSKIIEFNIFSFVIDWFLLFSGILYFLKTKTLIKRILASSIPFLSGYVFVIISLILPLVKQIALKGNERIDIMKFGYPNNNILIETILGTIVFFILLIIIEKISKQNEQKVSAHNKGSKTSGQVVPF